jgi:peroxiredoxin Q/BCP
VSPDTEASHASFKAKHGLPFTLLADPDHEVA